MRTWPSRGGIRCAICSRSTNRSGSSSAPTPRAGPLRSICTKPPALRPDRRTPGLARDQIEIHAEESRVVIRGERAAAGHDALRAVPSRRARPRPLLARVHRCPSRSTSSASPPISKDGLLTVTIPKPAARRRDRRVDVDVSRDGSLIHRCRSCSSSPGSSPASSSPAGMRTAADSRAAEPPRAGTGTGAASRTARAGRTAPRRRRRLAGPTSRASPARP